jgi:hypothetical protein
MTCQVWTRRRRDDGELGEELDDWFSLTIVSQC